MGVLFLIVFFFVAFLIISLVLLQEGKGGGLTGMSAGMDGVMGAKNPLRRMTAYLFVFFVLLAITINWYFHQRSDTSLPAAATNLPITNVRELQEEIPAPGTMVVEDESIPAEAIVALPSATAIGSEETVAPAEQESNETPAEEPAVHSTLRNFVNDAQPRRGDAAVLFRPWYGEKSRERQRNAGSASFTEFLNVL